MSLGIGLMFIIV